MQEIILPLAVAPNKTIASYLKVSVWLAQQIRRYYVFIETNKFPNFIRSRGMHLCNRMRQMRQKIYVCWQLFLCTFLQCTYFCFFFYHTTLFLKPIPTSQIPKKNQQKCNRQIESEFQILSTFPDNAFFRHSF